MGRGRQKAKHTKVARELKYFSPDTNYRELEQELSTPTGIREPVIDSPQDSREDADQYAEWSRDDR